MFLHSHQRDGAAQTRHAVFVRRNHLRRNPALQHLVRHFGFNQRTESLPGSRQIAHHDNPLRGHARHDHAHSAPQKVRHLADRLRRSGVAVISAREQVDETHLVHTRSRFRVIPLRRAIRGEHFPAALAPAIARRAVRIERNVPELARHSVQAANQLAIGVDARADAFRHRHHHHVAARLQMIEPHRRQYARVGRVLQFHFEPGGLRDGLVQIHVAPLQIWREYQAARRMVVAARQRDADAFDHLAAAPARDSLDRFRDRRDRRLRLGRRRHHFLRSELTVCVRERHDGLSRPHVHADNDAVVVQPQESWAPSARQPSCGPFAHPLLANQLLDDQRDRAPLQSRKPRQIGARNRLPRANQVEHDAAVDVPHHFARCHLHRLRIRMRQRGGGRHSWANSVPSALQRGESFPQPSRPRRPAVRRPP